MNLGLCIEHELFLQSLQRELQPEQSSGATRFSRFSWYLNMHHSLKEPVCNKSSEKSSARFELCGYQLSLADTTGLCTRSEVPLQPSHALLHESVCIIPDQTSFVR